jgi:hypothetical protein
MTLMGRFRKAVYMYDPDIRMPSTPLVVFSLTYAATSLPEIVAHSTANDRRHTSI